MTIEHHNEDLELVRDVIAGDGVARRAFAERMRCVPRILASQNARLGRHLGQAELEDLAQETLLRVLTKLGDYAGRARLETWIYRFCYLELMNALRRRARTPHLISDLGGEDGAGPEPSTNPSHPTEPGGELGSLGPLVKQLSQRESEVVRLRHVAELDTTEIATALGISVSSVKTHYYRGLEKLRQALIGKPRSAAGEGR